MNPADLSPAQYYDLFEDLVEFRGWLAGYRDLLRDGPEDEENRIRREEVERLIKEYDLRVDIG